jgi:hypothetical protein
MSSETERTVRKTCSTKEARGILKKSYFFGPEEWDRHFKNFDKTNVPEIPWTKDELKRPGINQKHFLFLGLERLNSQDDSVLNLGHFYEVFDKYLRNIGEKQPIISYPATLSKTHASTRWYLMPVGIVKGTENLLYKQQIAVLPKNYEVPSPTERILGNILYFLNCQKYLDVENQWTFTNAFQVGQDHEEEYTYDGWIDSTRTVHGHSSAVAISSGMFMFGDGTRGEHPGLTLDGNRMADDQKNCMGTGMAASLKLPF